MSAISALHLRPKGETVLATTNSCSGIAAVPAGHMARGAHAHMVKAATAAQYVDRGCAIDTPNREPGSHLSPVN